MTSMKTKILKYALLPGIISRLYALFTSGFSFSAYLIANIYQSVRLLPPNHPYLNPNNVGSYGIRHVIGEAANHLVFKRQNIDQIVVFFLLLSGLVLLVSQFALLIVTIIAYQPVLAQDGGASLAFFTRAEDKNLQDIAMILMDRVFGVSGIFNSCISVIAESCTDMQGNPIATPAVFPFPFHIAFRQLLAFYSMGMFFVGALMILYFVTVVIGETAASGTPFGERYNKTWVPVRIILFFALLVPFSGNIEDNPRAGLNTAQIGTLMVAKAGSNFASNGWELFTTRITEATLQQKESLIAKPNIPELDQIIRFMFLAKTCKMAEELAKTKQDPKKDIFGGNGIEGYIVRPKQILNTATGSDSIPLSTATYQAALDHSKNERISIRFGSSITDKDHPQFQRHNNKMGKVFPVCGEITLDVTNIGSPGMASYEIQKTYFKLLQNLWTDQYPVKMNPYAACFAKQNHNCTEIANAEFKDQLINAVRTDFNTKIQALLDKEAAEGHALNLSENLSKKGWGGAGIWYNQIAELNGAITTAVLNLPAVSKYPFVMEYVAGQKALEDENISYDQMYYPKLKNDREPKYEHNKDRPVAHTLYKAHQFWNFDNSYSSNVKVGQSPFIDAIKFVFGVNGIFDLLENPSTNPLAQLSALGKGMMEASIRNIGVGITGTLVGKSLDGLMGSIATVGGNFFKSVGFITIATSFTLYYILPLMPFIYFIFAVGGWVKSIFEAIVAMPLWALAHVSRWDGEGIAGPGATNGYFLIFEIFLRPIMILFGLLVSVSVFSALVLVLNDIFTLVVSNVGGFNETSGAVSGVEGLTTMLRGPIDELFYTVIYTITCYMIGVSAFKLIDQIPNEMLRWAGFTVKAFQEEMKDVATTISSQVYSKGNIASSKLSGSGLSGGQLAGMI